MPWSKSKQLKTTQVEAMQQRLTALGLYHDKIDGKAGMLTRAALGAYQKKNGLKVDCWPTAAVLEHMHALKSKCPARGRALQRVLKCASASVANLDAAVAPAIAFHPDPAALDVADRAHRRRRNRPATAAGDGGAA